MHPHVHHVSIYKADPWAAIQSKHFKAIILENFDSLSGSSEATDAAATNTGRQINRNVAEQWEVDKPPVKTSDSLK